MISKIIAGGMLRTHTPVEEYSKYGLLVKREDKSCPRPGPPFSKARGVYAHLLNIDHDLIGVLDTAHSQAGHAVARACQILGKKCINYYPQYKADTKLRDHQLQSESLGAKLHSFPAGRSCILFNYAKRHCEERDGYMMPNALKLRESVVETAKEVDKSIKPDYVIVPISSGTIAAGVVKGFGSKPTYLIHLGYSRSHAQVRKYIREASGIKDATIKIIDEKYSYKDVAREGKTPPFPCNPYYDLKAFRWWLRVRERFEGTALFWNIG